MASMDSAFSISLEAGADLSAAQFRFMELTSGQVTQANAGGEAAYGVLLNKPAAQGRAAEVAIMGIVKVVAGAAVSSGAKVQTDTSGRAIAALTGDHVLGVALETAGAAGDVIRVLLVSQHILA